MNQDNKLQQGQVFKNYQALCEYLNIPKLKTGSNQYKAQLKALSQVCKYHKQGHKIIIYEVFQVAKPKPNRMTDSKLIKLGVQYNLLRIMLSELNHQDVININNGLDDIHTYYFIQPTLHKATGLVGDVYYASRHHQEQIAELEGMPLEHVQDFFNCTHKKLNRYLEDSLKELNSKRLVTYSETKKLTFRYDRLDYKDLAEVVEDGFLYGNRVYSHSYATHDQLAFIMKCEREVMDKFNLSTFNLIYSRSVEQRKRFFRQCVTHIRKQAKLSDKEEIRVLKDLHKYSKCYQMSFIPSWIEKELKRVGKQLSYDKSMFLDLLNAHTFEDIEHLPTDTRDMKDYVNTKNIKSIKGNIKTRHDRAKEDSIRTSDDYVSNSNTLTDNYVSRSCGKAKEKLETNGLMNDTLIQDERFAFKLEEVEED